MTFEAYAEWRAKKAGAHEDVAWGEDELEFPGVDRLELLRWGNLWHRTLRARVPLDYGTPPMLPEGW
jgi:hypothetical protein